MALNILIQPVAEPVSLAEAKLQCKAEGAEEDALLSIYIQAVRKMAEHELGRVLMPQTWELTLDRFPFHEIELALTPLQSIVSVKYLDINGDEQTLAPSSYYLEKERVPGWLFPAVGAYWPDTLDAANSVRIQILAGYADAASVPSNIKLWMLAHIGTWFRSRESVNVGNIVTKMPGLDSLLDRERVWYV